MFCKYKNIFGKVGEGVHSYRLFNIAVVDVVATIVLAYIINKIFPQHRFKKVLLVLFLLGIVAHRLFCVRTTIDKLLFKNIQ
jgi:hypothetical protein